MGIVKCIKVLLICSLILLVVIVCKLQHLHVRPLEPLRFLYLVQTESCLPRNLASPKVLGDPSSCNCDVLVLNFKERCSNISLPHVEYVFNSSTTWTTGRNLLYELAMKRSETYHYYIFLDDDINLSSLRKKNETYQNLWRAFESSLKSVEPAVGVLYMEFRLRYLNYYRKQKNCSLNGTHEFIPTVYFDPSFDAFHYKAVQHILPYSARFDDITWWYSHYDAHIKSELIFRGQVVKHTYIVTDNSIHRPYKKAPVNNTIIFEMVNDVVKMLPKQYQNMTLVKEWKKYGLRHEQTSSTICLPPLKPHEPIVPFRHFASSIS